MKTIAVILVLLIAAAGITYSYRAYKEKTETDLAARRLLVEERENETRRLADATKEAQRLATLQAEKAAAAEEEKLAAMRQEQAQAEARRLEAEKETARWNQQIEDLRRQKEATIAMGERSDAQRQADLAVITAAQNEVLAKLRILESEKSQMASRKTALAAALEQQIELEKRAQERATRTRTAPLP